MQRDIEFGILQIVDIALKAISPAVNDPTTALTCIDHLGRVLMRAPFVSHRRRRSVILTAGRVILPRTSFARLLDVAFSQIGHYGKADVAVPLRLMRLCWRAARGSRMSLRLGGPPSGKTARGRLYDFPDAERDELNNALEPSSRPWRRPSLEGQATYRRNLSEGACPSINSKSLSKSRRVRLRQWRFAPTRIGLVFGYGLDYYRDILRGIKAFAEARPSLGIHTDRAGVQGRAGDGCALPPRDDRPRLQS